MPQLNGVAAVESQLNGGFGPERFAVVEHTLDDRQLAARVLDARTLVAGTTAWAQVDGVLGAAERQLDRDTTTSSRRARWGTWLIIGAAALLMLIALFSLGSARRRAERFARVGETESLTGLLTHQAFRERLEWAVDRPRSAGCLVVFDVDRLTLVNDTKGHLVGDEVLVGVGSAPYRTGTAR